LPGRCSSKSWRNGVPRSRRVLMLRRWRKRVFSKHSLISSAVHRVDSNVDG